MDQDLDLHLDEISSPSKTSNESLNWKKKWIELLSSSSKKSTNHYGNFIFYIFMIALISISSMNPILSPDNMSRKAFTNGAMIDDSSNNALVKECKMPANWSIPVKEPEYLIDPQIIAKQTEYIQQVESNINGTVSYIHGFKNQLNQTSDTLHQLSSQLEVTKLKQQKLEEDLSVYQNISSQIQLLESRWVRYSPTIVELDRGISVLSQENNNMKSQLIITRQLKLQTKQLELKLNRTLTQLNSLHSLYSSKLAVMEKDMNKISHVCDASEIEKRIEVKLAELIKNETTFTRKSNDRPIASNSSLPWIDYASIRLGGQIVSSMTSPTFFPIDMHLSTFKFLSTVNIPMTSVIPTINRFYNLLGIDVGVGKPEDALSEDMSLGSCWPLQGSNGIITVKLKVPIRVVSVTIDHIPKSLAIDARSALEKFRVIGAIAASGPYKTLLDGIYSLADGVGSTQTFLVDSNVNDEPLQYISLNIMSNHGHPDYTCLYRFRVHGKPAI